MNLKAENRVLKERHRQSDEVETGKVVQYGKFVYSADDSDHLRPFCLNCWAFERKLVPLMITDKGAGVVAKCRKCDKSD